MEQNVIEELLVCAVRSGDVEGVKNLLENQKYVGASAIAASLILPRDDPDCPGASLMILAAGKGYADMVSPTGV